MLKALIQDKGGKSQKNNPHLGLKEEKNVSPMQSQKHILSELTIPYRIKFYNCAEQNNYTVTYVRKRPAKGRSFSLQNLIFSSACYTICEFSSHLKWIGEYQTTFRLLHQCSLKGYKVRTFSLAGIQILMVLKCLLTAFKPVVRSSRQTDFRGCLNKHSI